MKTYKRGSDLPKDTQSRICQAFVWRMTIESLDKYTASSNLQRQSGYRLPIVPDSVWLANTWFPVKKDGTLGNGACEERNSIVYRTAWALNRTATKQKSDV